MGFLTKEVFWIMSAIIMILCFTVLVPFMKRFTANHVAHPHMISRYYNLLKNDSQALQTYGRRFATMPECIHSTIERLERTVSDKLEALPDVKVKAVDCTKLVKGNKKEISRAIRLTKSSHVKLDIVSLTASCKNFRKFRGYLDFPLSKEENEFPIAYGIVMYKDPEQTERLLRAIYRPQNYHCIHVDKKASKDVVLAMEAIASCFENVALASKPVSVRWGTSSVVEAEFACMRDLWNHTRWRYYINLTGQEFPLKTNLELVKILKTLNGANIIHGKRKQRPKYRTDFVYKDLIRTKTRKSAPPHKIQLAKGSMKMAMSRSFVDYILHSQVAQDFKEWVKDTYIPDETFFQSLNHNPQLGVPGAFTGNPDDTSLPLITRFVIWYESGKCSTQWVRQCCALGVIELQQLNSSPRMFANKFFNNIQPVAYDCMEELHFMRTRQQILGQGPGYLNMSFYENLPYVTQHVGVSPEYKEWHMDSRDKVA